MPTSYSHIIGIDDAPFLPEHRGDVLIVGAVYAAHRLEGVLHNRIRRDGANSTQRIVEMIRHSRFASHLQMVMLQGIAFGGFNVVDIHALRRELDLPILVVTRRKPNPAAIRKALLERVRGGQRKWKLIQAATEVEPMEQVFVQRCGISKKEAQIVVRRCAVSGNLPEPLRTAHLIAGGMSAFDTRQRA